MEMSEFKKLTSFNPKYINNTEDVFLGIELELETGHNKIDTVNSEHVHEIQNLYEDLFYFNRDITLSGGGYEITSQPFSFNWYLKNKEVFRKLVKILIKNKYSIHANKHTAMHVHITNNFRDMNHLSIFMKFIYENPTFMNIIAERNQNECCQQISMSQLGIDIVRQQSQDRNVKCRISKHNTIEVRVFENRVNTKQIMKNIEFVWSLYQFSKLELGNYTPNEYIDYIHNIPEFVNIDTFLQTIGEI